ncbi:PDGLE domain-containing protein [Pseudonocardia abyssalis]|uniref:PDGLE domain-containing protein n=1 Tax=Pseudonocardia abyssalis TaxID=2792008 RepID=A0ABS6UPN3_9PSEU|nr:PDGLE domain-containing protein [Pseudonocardia abyssalis]MBW0115560.1 PDGLE domain-containing protein [Pseudonocardia abyssalis]MBW0134210.1 PDGLE domain-containing protein [Pseudonocardia abyssalis]
MSTPTRSRTRFYVGFLLVALLIAGGLSYFASSDPDGLDSVTLSGCTLDGAGEPVGGTCIAQNAEDHHLSDSPLADYAIGGSEGSVGAAGIIGVIVTLVVAGGLFWVLRKRSPK